MCMGGSVELLFLNPSQYKFVFWNLQLWFLTTNVWKKSQVWPWYCVFFHLAAFTCDKTMFVIVCLPCNDLFFTFTWMAIILFEDADWYIYIIAIWGSGNIPDLDLRSVTHDICEPWQANIFLLFSFFICKACIEIGHNP